MRRTALLLTAAGLLAGVTACVPKERLYWSPDGRWALLLGGDDGLYVCDPNGTLSARQAEHVQAAAWFPDNRQCVFVQQRAVPTWAKVEDALKDRCADCLDRIRTTGEAAFVELQAHKGELEGFEPASIKGVSDGELAAVVLYLRDVHGDALRPRIKDEEWENFAKAEAQLNELILAEVDAGRIKPGRVLLSGLAELNEPRIAPNGKLIAIARQATGGFADLLVIPVIAEGQPRVVAERTAASSDWSADSRQLAYTRTDSAGNDSDEMRLGALERRMVANADGSPPDPQPDAEQIGALAFSMMSRVRYLSDERVGFVSAELSLPCAVADLPQGVLLYAADPGRQPTISRLLTRQAQRDLPSLVPWFAPSPDGEHVCLPGAEGQIGILTLSTGEVWMPLGDENTGSIACIPTWRSANELCAAVKLPDHPRADIALLTFDYAQRQVTQKIISTGWSDEIVDGFLRDKEHEPPTTAPASNGAESETK